MTTRRMLMGAVLTALALAAYVGHAADANVTGEWLMTVQTDQGSGSPTFILEQKGTAVTGSYKGQLGEAPVTGTVTGDEVKLTYKVNAQGFELEVVYAGTVTGDTMSGSVDLGPVGKGTFTGKKK